MGHRAVTWGFEIGSLRVTTVSEMAQQVRSAQAGAVAAFGTLVARYQDMAYATAYARLGDAHLAEDVTQEAMIDAFRKIEALRDRRAFGAWLRRIVVTHCSRMRRRPRAETNGDDAIARMQSNDGLPLRTAERSELRERVAAILRTLPPAQREATVMYYVGGKSVAEVAHFLGAEVGAVKKRLHDARRKLEAKLIDLVEETLHASRPSRDRRLLLAVQLCSACIAGDVAVARRALREDPTLLECHGEVADAHKPHMRRIAAHDGWPPLHLAAHYGHLPVVKLLVERGADLEAVSHNSIGNTALAAASFGNRFDVVRYLLGRGASLDARNRNGKTALDRAAETGRTQMAQLLRGARHDRPRP